MPAKLHRMEYFSIEHFQNSYKFYDYDNGEVFAKLILDEEVIAGFRPYHEYQTYISGYLKEIIDNFGYDDKSIPTNQRKKHHVSNIINYSIRKKRILKLNKLKNGSNLY